MRITEFLIRAGAALGACAIVVSPYVLATFMPNAAAPTGLELHGSLWLGVLVRLQLIVVALGLLIKSAALLTKGEQLPKAFGAAGLGGALVCLVAYLGLPA